MDEKTSITNFEIMKNDISYVKSDVAEMKASLKIVLEKYVHKDEMQSRLDRLQTEIDKRFDGAHSRIETISKEVERELEKKVDEKDFAPFRKAFWTIVTTVFTTAILGGIYLGTRL